MNKILQSASTGDINVTNDGATILKAIQLDNAAAKILVNISKVQDDEVGDGTTSVTVLAAELLREAEKLIAQKIHPQTIVEGFRIASLAALKSLEAAAVDNRSISSLSIINSSDHMTAQILLSSGKIYSTSRGQHYPRKYLPKTSTILLTLPSMLFFDSRYALASDYTSMLT
jgi:chaperonin GroEL (HSP60 family)